MGILNLTPDSFYISSRKNKISEAISEVEKMLRDGADIIDIADSAEVQRSARFHQAVVKVADAVLAVDRQVVIDAVIQGMLVAARKKWGTYREIEAQYNEEAGANKAQWTSYV